jgi:hypothetical protein
VQATLPPQLAEFADLARGYCGWCEGHSFKPNPEAQASRWLSRLYASALSLPPRECENENGPPDLPAAELAQAESNLAPFMGWYYRECFDPHPYLNDEPVMGDVGDDLLDVYKDIKRGLVLFEAGDINDSLWYWSFLHKIHWGRHAVGGLFALHCMHISKMD